MPYREFTLIWVSSMVSNIKKLSCVLCPSDYLNNTPCRLNLIIDYKIINYFWDIVYVMFNCKWKLHTNYAFIGVTTIFWIYFRDVYLNHKTGLELLCIDFKAMQAYIMCLWIISCWLNMIPLLTWLNQRGIKFSMKEIPYSV